MNQDILRLTELNKSVVAISVNHPETESTCATASAVLDLMVSFEEDKESIRERFYALPEPLDFDLYEANHYSVKGKWLSSYDKAIESVGKSKVLAEMANDIFGSDPKIEEERWCGVTDNFSADVAALYMLARMGSEEVKEILVNCPEVVSLMIDDLPKAMRSELFSEAVNIMNEAMPSHIAVPVDDGVQVIPMDSTKH